MTDTQLDTHIKTALKFHFPTSAMVCLWSGNLKTTEPNERQAKNNDDEYNENSNDDDCDNNKSNSNGNVVNNHASNGADDEQCK